MLMYTHYLYPLEVAAAILLVGMIAAIALTLRHRKDVKAINPADQVRVKWADRLTVVKMDATQACAISANRRDHARGEKSMTLTLRSLFVAGGDLVCALCDRYFSQSEKPDRVVDGH